MVSDERAAMASTVCLGNVFTAGEWRPLVNEIKLWQKYALAKQLCIGHREKMLCKCSCDHEWGFSRYLHIWQCFCFACPSCSRIPKNYKWVLVQVLVSIGPRKNWLYFAMVSMEFDNQERFEITCWNWTAQCTTTPTLVIPYGISEWVSRHNWT